MRNPEQTVGNITDKLKTTFIGSIDKQGYPSVGAMLQPRKRGGVKVFYFTTNMSSIRARRFPSGNKTCAYFYNNRFFRGATLHDTMEALTDTKSKEMIRCGRNIEYYSRGVTNPNHRVLEFTAISGRFYDNCHSEGFTVKWDIQHQYLLSAIIGSCHVVILRDADVQDHTASAYPETVHTVLLDTTG